MSFESPIIVDRQHDNENNPVITYHRREAQLGSTDHYTSSMVVNIRQLQTDLQAQHQHQKSALNELNQRFHLFVDRIQILQSQNAKYISAIAGLRRQKSGFSNIDIQWDERNMSLYSDLSAVSSSKVDYEWDFELFQLQMAIYQQLIEIEHQGRGKRSVILEDELKQSTSALLGLRKSYTDMQREVEMLYAEGDDLFKQYMTLTHDWCNIKKQRKKWELNMKTLKSYIGFYKSLHSYSGREFESGTAYSGDVAQYWAMEFDRIVKKIRQDFEAFYASIHREMIAYYDAKLIEVEKDVKQTVHYQQSGYEESSVFQQTHQVEYEKVQKSFSYEREIQMKLQATFSKLEADLRAIQVQHEERFEIQSRELNSIQENIMMMVYDVDDIRRSKASLEAEIIVYRNLLDNTAMGERVTVIHPPPPVVDTDMMGKVVVKRQKKKWIGIKECAPNGAYISLINHSSSKDIDISRWVLKQHIDSSIKLRYAIPNGIRIERGGELRIYASQTTGASADHSYGILVNQDIVSWGVGNTVESMLFNQNGDEEASYSQSVAFRKDYVS